MNWKMFKRIVLSFNSFSRRHLLTRLHLNPLNMYAYRKYIPFIRFSNVNYNSHTTITIEGKGFLNSWGLLLLLLERERFTPFRNSSLQFGNKKKPLKIVFRAPPLVDWLREVVTLDNKTYLVSYHCDVGFPPT